MVDTTVSHPTVEVTVTKNVVKASKLMSRQEVAKYADTDSLCLIIIGDNVYDCTRWQKNHPGGHLTVRALCGKDATDPFNGTHPRWVKERMLSKFFYAKLDPDKRGTLPTDTNTKVTKDDEATLAFRVLTKNMEEAGLFETDYTFYYKKLAIYACLFLVILGGVLLSKNVMVHAFSGILLGIWWQQLAFIGHDLCHNSVTHNRIHDSCIGLFLGNFCTGIGIGWWKRSHNVHHIVTNSCTHDADIQHLPIFAIDPILVTTKLFSTFANMYMPLSDITHVLVKYQQWLYYPVMAFARFNLYVQSLNHALRLSYYRTAGDVIWRQNLQIASLAGFWTWLLALTFSLPTWESRVLFFFPAHMVTGMLHVQITVSHWPMETYTGVTYDNSSNGFLRTQLSTTMDIDCPTFMDWFHGGLQFQVVHHLWPGLPRHNLRQVRGILESFCKKHELVYHHAGFFKANCMVLDTLKQTAKSTKDFSELFHESANLMG
uniref:Cytochrome b5 heme-binding domain-containing protein n=1 Tax=Pseudo-nitzschia australis TaxID=44445 RepID=A0A7S4AQ59_9STRA